LAGVISGVTIDRYTVTTDAFCSNAIDSTDPSTLRRRRGRTKSTVGCTWGDKN
jgi:hypothetical protein